MIKYVGLLFNKNITKIPIFSKNCRCIMNFSSNNQQKYEESITKFIQIDPKNHSNLSKVNQNNLPSKSRKVSQFQTISNQGKRVELQIFSKEHQPSFIRQYIENSLPAKAVREYNPHMTNGGQQFQQFPLIKLLSIALRQIQQDNIQVNSWRKLQYFIKKRLHRCTIEQNLKLLYIMLKSFPKYTFDYNFIMSICFALKKQMGLMNSDQLKSLFYVLYTNRNQVKRYNNQILANIQSLILYKVIEKCEKKLQLQQKIKGTHLPIEYLYSWIMYGFTLSVRNNYFEEIYQERALQLLKHFNERWQAAVLKQQHNKITSIEQIAKILYFTCIFDKLIQFRVKDQKNHPKGEKSKRQIGFRQQFDKFKENIIMHTSRKIGSIFKLDNYLHRIRTFRALIQLYSFQIVENILPSESQTEESTIRYQKINHLFNNLMKSDENTKEILRQKLKILNKLYTKGLISFDTFKIYYKSLANLNTVQSSQDIVNEIIMAELYIFEKQDKFSPEISIIQQVLKFIQISDKTYRNFDWHSFHFVSQLLQKSNEQSLAIGTNLPVENSNQNSSQYQQKLKNILRKIGQQVKFYNTTKLVNQQIQILKNKPELKSIQKFFIEIRVNEMQKLKPILSPFNRLPHFSNEKEKIAINALNSQEIECVDYKLQKKLLNISGWRVINLNSANFVQLTLNERLKFIAECSQKQSKLVEKYRQNVIPLLKRI